MTNLLEQPSNPAAAVAPDWAKLLSVAIATGEPLDCATNLSDEVLRRIVIEDSGALAAVDAAVVRHALLEHDGNRDPNGLQLRGLKIIGDLDLDYAILETPLRLYGVDIDGDLHMDSIRGLNVELHDSRVKSIRLEHAQLEYRFVAFRSTISGFVWAHGGAFGSFILDESRIAVAGSGGLALGLALASVRADLSLGGLDANGAFDAVGVDVRGSLLMRGAKVACCEESACSTANHNAICLDSARVSGVLDLEEVRSGGALRARGAHVAGQLKLTNACVQKASALADLDLTGIQVENDAFLNGIGARSVSLTGATLGDLDLRSAKVKEDKSHCSVFLDLATVRERVLLAGAHIEGFLMIRGASVGGSIETTTGADPMQRARIGAIDLSNSTVAGDVRIGAVLTRGGLIAERAELHGVLDLAKFVRIAGFSGPAGTDGRDLLRAAGSRIRRLVLPAGQSSDRSLDLSGAVIDTLDASQSVSRDGKTIPSLSSTANVSIGAVDGSLGTNWRLARDWLDLSSGKGNRPFLIQPWIALARSFEQAGRESDGRRLRYEAADRLRKNANSWFGRAVWRPISKYTIGHGYYSQVAIAWIALIWVATTVLVGVNISSFTPTDRAAALVSDTQVADEGGPAFVVTTGSSEPGPVAYPVFYAPLYAIDVVLSPLGTGQSEAWRVSSDLWLSTLITAIKLVSWGLLGLFITGISGAMGRK